MTTWCRSSTLHVGCIRTNWLLVRRRRRPVSIKLKKQSLFTNATSRRDNKIQTYTHTHSMKFNLKRCFGSQPPELLHVIRICTVVSRQLDISGLTANVFTSRLELNPVNRSKVTVHILQNDHTKLQQGETQLQILSHGNCYFSCRFDVIIIIIPHPGKFWHTACIVNCADKTYCVPLPSSGGKEKNRKCTYRILQ